MAEEEDLYVLDVKEAIRLCRGSRTLLRSQRATLRALLKDPTSHSIDTITSCATTLKAYYRQSVIVSININRLIAQEAELLIYEPAGLAKLMQATFRLMETQQQVAELLKIVAKEKLVA